MLPNFVVEKLFITSYLLVIWPVGGLQLPPRTTLSGRAGCRQKADLLRSSIAESPRLMRHESKDNDEQFNWHKQWYPVLAEEHTNPTRVHAVQLLGKELVVWRDKEGRWACFDDRCPHRAVPLTEGRLDEEGNLMCAYHAWRFGADGKCLKIPQSTRGGTDEAQPKACAKVYPTQAAQGIIWVWAENGPDAGIESALTQPPLLPEYPGMKVTSSTISQRDLPCGWDFAVENILDPAHVPALHRYAELAAEAPVNMRLEAPITKAGFATRFPSLIGVDEDRVEFVPPTLVAATSTNSDGDKVAVMTYNVPTRPGWIRFIAYQANIKAEGSKKKARLAIRVIPNGLQLHQIPHWLQHMVGNYILTQDVAILHYQEKKLESEGVDSSTYMQAGYMPTSSDTGVIATRKWIAKFAEGGPPWDAGCDTRMTPKEVNRDVLLDIYEQHTKHCTTCLGALKGVEQLLTVAKIFAGASLAWMVWTGLTAVDTSTSDLDFTLILGTTRALIPGVSAMFTSLAAIKVLELLRRSFHVIPFHTQDRNL